MRSCGLGSASHSVLLTHCISGSMGIVVTLSFGSSIGVCSRGCVLIVVGIAGLHVCVSFLRFVSRICRMVVGGLSFSYAHTMAISSTSSLPSVLVLHGMPVE